MVAQGLPEAGDVVGSKLQSPHPLGTLPEVQVRHEQADRASVLWLKASDEPGFWETNGYHNRGDPWLEQRYWGD